MQKLIGLWPVSFFSLTALFRRFRGLAPARARRLRRGALRFASGAIGGCWRSVGRRGGAPKFVTYPLILIVHLPKGLTFTKKARVGTANGHFLK